MSIQVDSGSGPLVRTTINGSSTSGDHVQHVNVCQGGAGTSTDSTSATPFPTAVYKVPKAANATTPALSTVDTTAAEVFPSNSVMMERSVVNVGTTVLIIAEHPSTNPTTTSGTHVLAACGTEFDGKGGIYISQTYNGRLSIISRTVGGKYFASEKTA
jgi:hypothetical protein